MARFGWRRRSGDGRLARFRPGAHGNFYYDGRAGAWAGHALFEFRAICRVGPGALRAGPDHVEDAMVGRFTGHRGIVFVSAAGDSVCNGASSLKSSRVPASWRPAFVLVVLMLAAWSGAMQAKELPKWELGIGAGAMRLPDYRGSDESQNYVFPLPYVIYRGERLQLDRRGAAGVLFESERLELDVSATAANPARSGRNRAREGMPDLDPPAHLGPRPRSTLTENPTKSVKESAELPVRAVFAVDSRFTNRGWLVNPTVNIDVRDIGGSGWNFGAQAGPVFGDRRYHAYFYDVGIPYARSDRPAYTATSGYSGAHISAALSKRYASIWVGGFARAYSLHGASFEESPLVRTRSALLVGIGFAYIFATSSVMVEADD